MKWIKKVIFNLLNIINNATLKYLNSLLKNTIIILENVQKHRRNQFYNITKYSPNIIEQSQISFKITSILLL